MKKIFNSILTYLKHEFFIKLIMSIISIFTIGNLIYYLFIFNINSQPTGYFSALKLGWMIANEANCTNFEETSHNILSDSGTFLCETDGMFEEFSINVKSFSISVFSDIKEKEQVLEYLILNQPKTFLKVGPYFIVEYTGTGNNSIINLSDKSIIEKFPGTLYQY